MKMRMFVVASATVTSLVSMPFAAGAQSSGEMDLGTVYMTANSFCPRNALDANGQILSISANTALYSLLGTQYGGNGTTTFALPNLQGRVVKDQGSGAGLPNYPQGQIGGSESMALTAAQMPAHTHTATTTATATTNTTTDVHVVASAGNRASPVRGAFALAPDNIYSDQAPAANTMKDGTVVVNATTTVSPTTTIGVAGGSQPFNQLNPYLVLRFCVVTQGIYPSRP